MRVSIACSEACPEAASAGMYDLERLKIKNLPRKPESAPHLVPLRYPQSNDGADVAAYWAMEARQRGR